MMNLRGDKILLPRKFFLLSAFLFIFCFSFVSAYENGDTVCYADDDLLCTNVVIIGNNFYCDIDDIYTCEHGCANDKCINVEEPECSVGYEMCFNNSVYNCTNNQWTFQEYCSSTCVEQFVDYAYCDIYSSPDYNSSGENSSLFYIAQEIIDNSPSYSVSLATDSRYGFGAVFSSVSLNSLSLWILDIGHYAFGGDYYCDNLNLLVFNSTSLVHNISGNSPYSYLDSSTRYNEINFVFDDFTFDGNYYFFLDGFDSTYGDCVSPYFSTQNTSYPNNIYEYNKTTGNWIPDTAYKFQVSYEFSLNNLSEEGSSCGYMPDGSPFCGEGLSCDYFQCVATNDPTCSEVGGNVCSASDCSTGLYFENTVENWCCNGDCTSITPGELGDWCINDSVCEAGLDCIFFKCQNSSNLSLGDYSDFCDYDENCSTGLICLNDRCTYNKTSWLVLPSECSSPNDIACNNHDCVVSKSLCGLSGVVGEDCTSDDFMINYNTGIKEPCRAIDRSIDSFSSVFPTSPSGIFKYTIIFMVLISFIVLMFVTFGRVPILAFALSGLGVEFLLVFFARIGYISYTIPVVLLVGFLLLLLFKIGGSR